MRIVFRPAVFLFALCVLLLSANSAYAYLDAGTGSMILQVLLGGLASLAVILKIFWRRILSAFGIKKKEKEDIKPPVSKS